jgi:glycine dehydrogenase subunit 1
MGKNGIRKAAELCLQKSHYAAEQISKIDGFKKVYDAPFFKEFVIQTPLPSNEIISSFLKKNVLAGLDLSIFDRKLKNQLLICVTEKRTKEEMDLFADELRRLR